MRAKLTETRARAAAATMAGLALLASAACGQKPSETARPSAPAAAERFVVRLQTTPDIKPMAATVTSRDMADARARIGGTLVRVAVKAGDMVRRGQVIAVVSDPKIGLQTSAFAGQAAAAAAQSAAADAELARIQDLYDHGVYAKARLDQAVAAAHGARGAYRAASAQRAASAEAGAEGAILAPAAGRVLTADVPAGSVVMPGQSVATLTAGPTVLRVEAPEADAANLRVGQVVALAPDPGHAGPRQAVISKIYPSVTAGTVEVDLDAPGLSSALVGQRMAVRLALGQRQAVLIPRRFVVTRFGIDYVEVLGSDGAVSDAPVQLAPGPEADQAEALSGVSPGDVLVLPGAGR